MRTSTRTAGALAAIALTVGSLGTMTTVSANATGSDSSKPAACAQEQKQLDKANEALAKVTAVFEKQKDKVAKAKDQSEAATTAHQRNEARKALAAAKKDRDEAKKDKTAHQERVEKAQARLADCQADQPAS